MEEMPLAAPSLRMDRQHLCEAHFRGHSRGHSPPARAPRFQGGVLFRGEGWHQNREAELRSGGDWSPDGRVLPAVARHPGKEA